MSTCSPRLLLSNAADTATLVADPALEATLPVTNLQLQESAATARSTSTASQRIKFDFTDSRVAEFDMFVLLGNFSEEAVVSLVLYDGANQTGNIVWSTSATVWGLIPWEDFVPWGAYEWGGGKLYEITGSLPGSIQTPGDELSGGELYLSGEFVVEDTNNTDGFIDLSRLMIGRYIQPEFGTLPGSSLRIIDPSEQERDEGGGLVTFPEQTYRGHRFSLQYISKTEFPEMYRGIREAGKQKDIYVDMYPKASGVKRVAGQMRAKFTEVPALTEWAFDWYNAEFEIEEVR